MSYVTGPSVIIVRCPGCAFLRTIAWNGPGRVIAHDWDSVPVPATSDLAVADGADEEQHDADDGEDDPDCDEDGERDHESHDDEDDPEH